MDVDEARVLLEAERARLATVLAALSEQLDGDADIGELSVVDQHQADVASELFEVEAERSVAAAIATDIEEVDAALGRLDAGTYGRCGRCGCAIGDDRLLALPAARYCVPHELAMEAVAVPVDRFAADEALRHLDLLPSEDEPDGGEAGLSAEEAAMHEREG